MAKKTGFQNINIFLQNIAGTMASKRFFAIQGFYVLRALVFRIQVHQSPHFSAPNTGMMIMKPGKELKSTYFVSIKPNTFYQHHQSFEYCCI